MREPTLPRGQSRDRVVAERDSQRRGSQWRVVFGVRVSGTLHNAAHCARRTFPIPE